MSQGTDPHHVPRVSVVMPAYNAGPFIEEAVGSILRQTFTDFELIVVDDGSTDDTAARVGSIEDPRVQLRQIEHAGLVGAENAGLGFARGEYVCRADADDVFAPTLLEREVEVLDREPGTAAVGVWHRRFGGLQAVARPATDPAAIRRRLRTSNSLAQPVMMRASCVAEVGGFRPVIWEDWDLWIRLAARWDVRNVPECLAMLRFRAGSVYRSAGVRHRELGRREARLTARRELGVDARSLVALTRSLVTTPIAPRLARLRSAPSPAPEPAVKPPTVTVIVPTYRRVELLGRCLAGVVAQEPQPDQIVVVHRPDDDPETAAWLSGWCQQEPDRRRAVTVDRPGLVDALRAGTAAASGEVVAYLDDDAVPRADWLAELRRGFLDPTVSAAGGRFVDHIDGREVSGGRAKVVGRVTWWGRVIGHHDRDSDYYGDVDLIPGANMAFRRDAAVHDPRLLRMHNGLVLGNELQSCLLLRKKGGRILYSPWAVVDHYTTSYRDPLLGSRVDGADLVAAAANYTFIMLGFLPWHRRIAYRLYAYLVGSANQSGPVRVLMELPRNHRRARAMAARILPTWQGRLRGERMFRAHRPRRAKLPALVGAQAALLLAYITLHSPLVPWLTGELGLRTPDFCYFVCT